MTSKRIFCFGAAGTVLLLAIIAGCALSPVDPGKVNQNDPPEVFFLNTYSMNDTTKVRFESVIYWYGTDADGFIDRYQVIIEKPVFSEIKETTYGGTEYFSSSDLMDGFIFGNIGEDPEDGEFTDIEGNILIAGASGHQWLLQTNDGSPIAEYITMPSTSSTSDTILFEAPTLEDVHRLWLRSIDNKDAASGVIYSDFLAITKPPEITIKYFNGYPVEVTNSVLTLREHDVQIVMNKEGSDFVAADSVISVYNTNPNWPGIWLTWEASDPDSGTVEYYKYRLDSGEIFVESAQDMLLNCTEHTKTESWSFKDEQYPGIILEDVPAGDHTFYVWAVDDAGAETPIPSVFNFHAVVPTREKDVLVIDDSWYGDESDITPGEAMTLHPHLKDHPEYVEWFYSELLDAVGVTYDFVRVQEPSGANNIDRLLLGDYKSILWVQECMNPQILTNRRRLNNHLFMTQELLDTGGTFMFVGYAFNVQLGEDEFIKSYGNTSVTYTGESKLLEGFTGLPGKAFADSDTMLYDPDWVWDFGGEFYYYPMPSSCIFDELSGEYTTGQATFIGETYRDRILAFLYKDPYYGFAAMGGPLYPLVEPWDEGGGVWKEYDTANKPFSTGLDEDTQDVLVTYMSSILDQLDVL